MQSVIIYIYTFIFLVTSFSCSKENSNSINQKLTAEEKKRIGEKLNSSSNTFEDIFCEYKEHKDAFVSNKKIGDFGFTLTYNTHFYLALKNGDSSIVKGNTVAFKNEISNYENLHYFNLKIENNKFNAELLKYNSPSEQEYTDRIVYYSEKCKNDIYIVDSGDTIRFPFINFERIYNTAPFINLTIVFERKSKSEFENLTFVFDDKIFNNGKIKFELDPETIILFNNPTIKNYKL